MTLAFLTFILVLSTNTSSQVHTAPSAPKDQQKDFSAEEFKPHMVDHFNQGCPANSECSPEMGKLYKRWTDTLNNFGKEKEGHRLLEKFRQNNGVPFEIWTTKEADPKEGLVYWDSPCEEHNLEGKPHYGIGFAMIKSLKDLKKLEDQKKIFLRTLTLSEGKGKSVTTYKTLRGETPLYIENGNLIYQKMDEGVSYGLSVGLNGDLKVVTTTTPKEFPQSVDCPQELIEAVKKISSPENLYSGHYCQRTWNASDKIFNTLMVGWSCN